MESRSVVIVLVVGLVAGFLASLVVGGGGILRYLVTGLIGAFVGSFLFRTLGISLGLGNSVAELILVSTIGAIIVVLLARLIA
jgi:uncharacterized membrane protein YeaQ/YmgE (transglycosylase-associated protein family)